MGRTVAGMRAVTTVFAAAVLACADATTPVLQPLGLRGGGGPPIPKRSMSCVGDWQTTSTLVVKGLQSREASHEVTAKFMKLDHLSDWLPQQMHESKLIWKGNKVGTDETILDVMYIDSERAKEKKIKVHQWVRAGPRQMLYFNPSTVVAAIVTCGGLCPGLNNVIRSVAFTLLKSYGAKKVYGVQFGYKGFFELPLQELTLDTVALIHKRGGTILGSSRGNNPNDHMDKIMDTLIAKGINQVYVVGGDGTHQGANAISQEAAKRKIAMTVCGVPKTIDNDVAFIDKSFGFDTAVAEAVKVINCALIEADDSYNGVGIVKLMGREAGFVAMYATIASNDVDICLIPEVAFDLDKLCKAIGDTIDRKGHCLIVVAEGAGSEHFEGIDLGKDPSGNKRLPDVGLWLKEQTKNWHKTNGRDIEVRYIDPSYQVRSVPAIASDAIYCSHLGSTAVHGAMSGYTGFSAGRVNQRYVYIPITEMCNPEIKVRVDPASRVYSRMVVHTGQPDMSPDTD